MKIFVTDRDGKEHEIAGIDGWQIMELIRDEGLSIKAECGGSCACALNTPKNKKLIIGLLLNSRPRGH